LFSRGQPPITFEDIKTIRISPRVRNFITSAFLDIRLLVNAPNVGGKVRTRFVEVIMLRTLMGDRLWKRHVGFLESDYESHKNLIQRMGCTEQEIRAWSTLTIRNITRNNPDLQMEKELDIDAVTDLVLEDISPFGGNARATREKLREIVSNVADLGFEIAKLPFEIRPIDLKPGVPFAANMMKSVDLEEEEEDMTSKRTTIILSYPWVKVTYDETGKGVYQRTYLSKAAVSCIC